MSPLALEHFMQAARAGMLVWVRDGDDGPRVQAGDRADPAARGDLGALLAVALREHYGLAASAVAEREFGLGERRQRVLPARTVLRAADCAESALSMLMAQATMLRFEFSAEYQGRRFRQLCRQLSIDPASLGPERRQALDRALLAGLDPTQPATAEDCQQLLSRLLTQGLH